MFTNPMFFEPYMPSTEMTRVRVESFTVSLDGYGAESCQSIDEPLGVGGRRLQ